MFGAKQFLLERWTARRSRCVPITQLTGVHGDGRREPTLGVSSLDLTVVRVPPATTVLFARLAARMGGAHVE